MEDIGSDKIYERPDYEEVLSHYWNNGTQQIEFPDNIIQETAQAQKKFSDKNS